MPISSPYQGPVEVSYLFIDGAYLRGVIECFGQECLGDSFPPIDYGLLARGYTKVFYYDCLAPQKVQESVDDYAARISAQEAHFKKLKSLRGWHVVEGIVKRSGKRARQKEVDILISVDMLTHTYRRNMHRLAFIAGDQDFRPLVEAVVREGMFIELWYEPTSASSELVFAADAHRTLDPYVIHSWLERSYQEAHPMPQRHLAQTKDIGNGKLIAQAITSSNSNAELYEASNHYTLIQPDDNTYKYFLHMSHTDLDFLKKIYSLSYGNVEWVNMI